MIERKTYPMHYSGACHAMALCQNRSVKNCGSYFLNITIKVADEKRKGRRRVERSGLSKVQFEVRLRDGNAAGFFFWSATSLYRIMLITTLNCSHIYKAVI